MTDTITSLVPLALLMLITGGLMAWAASKVDRNPILWFVFGAIPFVNFIFLWVAVWIVLVNLHRRLKALERGR